MKQLLAKISRALVRACGTLPVLLWFLSAQPALAQNCPAANPNDWNDDGQHIQDCLDANGAVYLQPGNPGYILERRVFFNSWNTVLSSVGGKATLRARADLTRAMIVVDGANYYEISELILDGNKNNRTRTDLCANPEPGFYAGAHGGNLIAEGVGYRIHHVDTINAMCGSGLEAKGTNFEIFSIFSADHGEEYGNRWADGITLVRCDGGYVHNNYIRNSTDVGLVVFKGNSCTIRFNTIENLWRFAFAGLKVGDPFGDPSVSLAGSVTKDNTVFANENQLGFGLMVGNHPWGTSGTVSDVGEVSYNSIEGAMTNLVIDGIGGGVVVNNSMSNPRGTRSLTCSFTINYTAEHFGGATIQGGYVLRHFHPGC
jgi:hypothetical protein